MKIINDDEYEGMAANYQCLEIARLNEVLKERGVGDAELRKAICEDYFFANGQFLDAGWLKSDDKTVCPVLCFAERAPRTDQIVGEIQTLHVTSDYFAFHEYAFGNVGEFFEEWNENVSDIENGS